MRPGLSVAMSMLLLAIRRVDLIGLYCQLPFLRYYW
jgi:hypothetical protein